MERKRRGMTEGMVCVFSLPESVNRESMNEAIEKALEKKADWYITKPFDPKHLLKRITYLLQKLKEKEIKEKSQEITE